MLLGMMVSTSRALYLKVASSKGLGHNHKRIEAQEKCRRLVVAVVDRTV